MYLLLSVICFALIFWLMFKPIKPTWIPAVEKIDPRKAAGQARGWVNQSGGWFKRLPTLWKKKPTLGALLQAWAQSGDLSAAAGLSGNQLDDLNTFSAWIASLRPAEVEAVAQECVGFCRARGIDLRWLVEDHGEQGMQKTLAGMVMFFGLAVRERAGARASVALRAWQDAPLAKQNLEFGKQLYIQLVEAGKIAIPSHLLMAPQKVRQAHLVSSIKALIAADRAALLPFAEAVLNAGQAKTTVTPAQPAAEAPAADPAPAMEPQPVTA
jgi:hypothetical protein